jgi:hypothetical protein
VFFLGCHFLCLVIPLFSLIFPPVASKETLFFSLPLK